jgi:hypothetical protein
MKSSPENQPASIALRSARTDVFHDNLSLLPICGILRLFNAEYMWYTDPFVSAGCLRRANLSRSSRPATAGECLAGGTRRDGDGVVAAAAAALLLLLLPSLLLLLLPSLLLLLQQLLLLLLRFHVSVVYLFCWSVCLMADWPAVGRWLYVYSLSICWMCDVCQSTCK